jgi:hypothetical protein
MPKVAFFASILQKFLKSRAIQVRLQPPHSRRIRREKAVLLSAGKAFPCPTGHPGFFSRLAATWNPRLARMEKNGEVNASIGLCLDRDHD